MTFMILLTETLFIAFNIANIIRLPNGSSSLGNG